MLQRLLQETAAKVVATGKVRRTRYALCMTLRGELAELPLHEVDTSDRVLHSESQWQQGRRVASACKAGPPQAKLPERNVPNVSCACVRHKPPRRADDNGPPLSCRSGGVHCAFTA